MSSIETEPALTELHHIISHPAMNDEDYHTLDHEKADGSSINPHQEYADAMEHRSHLSDAEVAPVILPSQQDMAVSSIEGQNAEHAHMLADQPNETLDTITADKSVQGVSTPTNDEHSVREPIDVNPRSTPSSKRSSRIMQRLRPSSIIAKVRTQNTSHESPKPPPVKAEESPLLADKLPEPWSSQSSKELTQPITPSQRVKTAFRRYSNPLFMSSENSTPISSTIQVEKQAEQNVESPPIIQQYESSKMAAREQNLPVLSGTSPSAVLITESNSINSRSRLSNQSEIKRERLRPLSMIDASPSQKQTSKPRPLSMSMSPSQKRSSRRDLSLQVDSESRKLPKPPNRSFSAGAVVLPSQDISPLESPTMPSSDLIARLNRRHTPSNSDFQEYANPQGDYYTVPRGALGAFYRVEPFNASPRNSSTRLSSASLAHLPISEQDVYSYEAAPSLPSPIMTPTTKTIRTASLPRVSPSQSPVATPGGKRATSKPGSSRLERIQSVTSIPPSPSEKSVLIQPQSKAKAASTMNGSIHTNAEAAKVSIKPLNKSSLASKTLRKRERNAARRKTNDEPAGRCILM